MYRNASDLSQLFSDSPAPRRIADAVRSKIEKFKVGDFNNFILVNDLFQGSPVRAGDDL